MSAIRVQATVTMVYEVEFEAGGPDTLAAPMQALLAARQAEPVLVRAENFRPIADAAGES